MSKDIQEAIERCEELIKPEHACWIGISNQIAIETALNYIETLEKELKEKSDFIDYIQAQKADILMYRNVVPKEVIEEKIEELKKQIDVTIYQKDITAMEHLIKSYKELEYKYNEVQKRLKEILEKERLPNILEYGKKLGRIEMCKELLGDDK